MGQLENNDTSRIKKQTMNIHRNHFKKVRKEIIVTTGKMKTEETSGDNGTRCLTV